MRTFILLIVGALLFPTTGFSQKANSIGFFYLPQKTGITNSLSDKGDPIYKNKTTFAGGGGISYNHWFNGMIGMQTGAMYISHNQKFVSELYEKGGTYKIVKGKKRLDYLKIPLLLTYTYKMSPKKKSRIHFSMFGGPQFGYLLKGDGAIIIYKHFEDGSSDFYDLPESSSEYYNKYLIDIVAGGGFEFEISCDISISTALRFDWSLSDVENKEAITYDNIKTYYFGDPERKKGHSNSIGIMFGINYKFGGGHLLNPSKKW